jgi:hypothetical protein
MDQIPATPPQVSYENGLLTIAAQNSTLGEILRAVRSVTGASVELPPNGAPDRVVTQLGPGAPRDVLAVLLNGTAFNYVMLGSTSDPRAIASVVLTSKPGGEVQTANVYQTVSEAPNRILAPQAFSPAAAANIPPQPAAAADADDKDDDADDDKDDDSDQAQQPAQPTQPGGAQPDPSAIAQPQPTDDGSQPNSGPRTPEQLLEMMRRGQPPRPPGQAQPPQD